MSHVFVFALCTAPSERLIQTDNSAPPPPEDAPLIVLLDGVPTLDRLIATMQATDGTVSADKMKAKLASTGLTDNTLAQSMVLLVRARADGHWPSIENRMEDGSLIVMQLLPVHAAKLIPNEVMTRFRRRQKSKEN